MLVGKAMYATLGTRFDIAYAVHILSKFLTNPGMPHFNEGKHTIRYLKGTSDWGIIYGETQNDPEVYVNADGNMFEDRKAVTGWIFLINGGAVSWSSRSQSLVSLSTAESEYVAATEASKEGLWLRLFISQIFEPTFPIIRNPTTMYSDNQAAIALSKDHQYHARTKHIDTRYHFIRYIIEEGKIKLVYCPTEEMVADTLTKALPSAKAKHFASAGGLRPV